MSVLLSQLGGKLPKRALSVFRCWLHGHDPLISDDMLIHIGGGEYDAGPVRVRLMPRTFPVGLTRCDCCGVRLFVEGIGCYVLSSATVHIIRAPRK